MGIPVMVWPGLVVVLALLFAFSWVLVRHIGLAVLIMLSPLPGLALAMGRASGIPPIFEYLPGFMIAVFWAGSIAPLAANMPARSVVRHSFQNLWRIMLASLLLFASAAFLAPGFLASVVGEVSAIFLTGFCTALFSFDEDFVVRINRVTEARLRQIEALNFLAEPRWGTSLGGVALVLSVLGFFGAQNAFSSALALPLSFALLAIVYLAGAVLVARNVRRVIATLAAMVPVALLTVAVALRFAISLNDLALPLATAAIPVLFMAGSARSFERSGDTAQTATLRGIERSAPAIVLVTIAGAAAALLSFQRIGSVESAALLFGGAAALILQPALTTMIYSLFPKRVTLEEAFRKR